jgi:hypothetical protein
MSAASTASTPSSPSAGEGRDGRGGGQRAVSAVGPSRWRVELEGGEGFRAIHRLLGSAVEYRRRDAFALDRLEERFDFVC